MKRIFELAIAGLIGAAATASAEGFWWSPPEKQQTEMTAATVCGMTEDTPCFVSLVGFPEVRTACGDSINPCKVEVYNDKAIEVSGSVKVYDGTVSILQNYPIDVRIKR